jgi:hypothetical protein
MRTLFSRFSAAASIIFASGCSTAPDISDVTLLDTAAVVRHIECETRIAILQNIVDYIKANAKDRRRAAIVAAAFEGDLIDALKLTRHLQVEKLYELARDDEDLATYIAGWDGVVIGYGYEFDISEQNNNGGGLSFAFPAGIHTVKLDATAGLDKTRQNKKVFAVVTSVPNLMQSRACLSREMVELNREPVVASYSPIGPRGEPDAETLDNIARSQLRNPIHPIVGSIGMTDVLQTFSDVWRGNVGGQGRVTALQPRSKSTYGLLPGSIAVEDSKGNYVQTLNFTTKVSGKIAPTIEVSGSNLTKGNFTSDNVRTDRHQVIITISAPSYEEIRQAAKRTLALRKKNEMEIAQFVSGRIDKAQLTVRAVAPGIHDTIDRERHLLALERLALERRQ